MFSKKKYIAVVTIILTLSTFTLAYAAQTTINTDDGQVDPNWSAVSALCNDRDDMGDDNYEWRADTKNGAADWSQCYGQINVQIMSFNPDFTIEDSTELRGYNAPTAVSLANLTASSETNIWAFLVVLTAMVLLLVGSIWLIKRLLKPPDTNDA